MIKRDTALALLTILSYLVMVAINALANILPIGGIGTGQVSDSYPNLFAPTGLTFSIWGVIYLLLAVFAIAQLSLPSSDALRSIRILFSLSSLANALWIFSWHYKKIALSVLLMLCILICLIRINQILRAQNLNQSAYWTVQLAFSIYLGWITVATIANITTFLVAVNWSGFGISPMTWTIIILLIGTAIGSLWALRYQDKAYLITLLWAYLGILLKHASAKGFSLRYPAVLVITILCMAVFAGIFITLLLQTQKAKPSA
ncbi:MAG: tryptophan-rich sensory protein [Sphaerochaeta sp.]|jgi:hypothetical protein|uniref:tryptophan-rich sensory protein n=1 Tax=Sphaerochaeta sp. TaxID=1972642 RepID=UPI002FCAEE13